MELIKVCVTVSDLLNVPRRLWEMIAASRTAGITVHSTDGMYV